MTAPGTEDLGSWGTLPFFHEDMPRIAAALDGRGYLPAPERVFAALRLTPPEGVRVLLLGQDPYPTPGHANGLAFSVSPDVAPLPRSLGNIFRELRDDTGAAPPSGDLSGWARQGVLLLNVALTVPPGEAGGHLGLGWEALTGQILQRLDRTPRALLLWGAKAQQRAAIMTHPDHLRIETAHPSPLSARRGFFGSRPFSRINAWLTSRGEPAIDWSAT